eukprot:6196243-Pleurochrysis_carterae.AAC.3
MVLGCCGCCGCGTSTMRSAAARSQRAIDETPRPQARRLLLHYTIQNSRAVVFMIHESKSTWFANVSILCRNRVGRTFHEAHHQARAIVITMYPYDNIARLVRAASPSCKSQI